MKKTRQDYIFVGVQLLLFVLYWFEFLPKLRMPLPVIGFSVALSMAGIAIVVGALWKLNRNLTPFPTPKPGAQLVQTGLYKWVRHPIYTGIIISVFSVATALGSPYKLLISAFLLVLFYLKTQYEEKKLMQQYTGYALYRKKTGRFFPKLKSISS